MLLAFFEAVKVFKGVLKGIYLIFRSILDKMNTLKHKHRSVNVKLFIFPICKCFTSGSDLITDGDGETFIHIFTERKSKIHTKFAFVNSVMNAKRMSGVAIASSIQNKFPLNVRGGDLPKNVFFHARTEERVPQRLTFGTHNKSAKPVVWAEKLALSYS